MKTSLSPLLVHPLLESSDPGTALATLARRTSEKWQRHRPGVQPAHIAEMDFPVAREIRQAIGLLVTEGDMGYAYSYTDRSPAQAALRAWLMRRYEWPVPPSRVLYYADVMRVIEAGLDAFSEVADAVVFDVPYYPSFPEATIERGRVPVGVPMLHRDGRWHLDLAGLERAFRDGATVYIRCDPHNPTGHVATPAELTAVAELAGRYGVTVLSDEVHSPLVFPGKAHIPFASVPAAGKVRSLTGLSASKGWNIAGLKCAFGIPGDAETAEALLALPARTRDGVGIFGAAATEAAYTAGGRWLEGVLRYLEGNRRLLAELLPLYGLGDIEYEPADATYLAWLDFRRVADRLADDDLAQRVFREGGLSVGDGRDYGMPGFLRLNLATPRILVYEMVRRLACGLEVEGPVRFLVESAAAV